MPRHAVRTLALIAVSAGLYLVLYNRMSAPLASQAASTYNEAEIVGLITDIYRILDRQGHYKDEYRRVRWAPPEGHVIDLSVLDDPSSIDARVVSLMKKLPSCPGSCLAPYMLPVDYLTPDGLVRSRDIDRRSRAVGPAGIDQTNALPTVLMLLDGLEGPDAALESFHRLPGAQPSAVIRSGTPIARCTRCSRSSRRTRPS